MGQRCRAVHPRNTRRRKGTKVGAKIKEQDTARPPQEYKEKKRTEAGAKIKEQGARNYYYEE
jgi:hypothetical protein